MLQIETDRLTITAFSMDMAEDVWKNSLDEDNRRFVPDEVFETLDEAKAALRALIACYSGEAGPFVFPVIRKKDARNLGYVQLAPVEDGWEAGFHIAKPCTGRGYATEAVRAFLPVMARRLGLACIRGICLKENVASCRVLEKCGFEKIFEGDGIYQGTERPICVYRLFLDGLSDV